MIVIPLAGFLVLVVWGLLAARSERLNRPTPGKP